MPKSAYLLLVACAIGGVALGLAQGEPLMIRQGNQLAASPEKWTEYSDLATLIERLPAWRDRDFSADEWQRYLEVGAALQDLATEDVQRVLLIYLDRAWHAHRHKAPREAFTQPMILLRVMFETSTDPLDERARGAIKARGVTILANSFLYKPFDPKADRTVRSVSLPVAFDADGPHLVGSIVSNIPGSTPSRPWYEAHLEYRAFAEMYKHRDLSTYLDESVEWRRLVARMHESAE